MTDYSIAVIPIDKFITTTNGSAGTPWFSGYHDPSGAQWNYAPWTISFSLEDIVKIDIQDLDADPGRLNDDSWWNGAGRGSQTIQSNLGYASPGDDITDEYELQFTAIVDGVEKTYTLAAIAVIKPGDSGLTPNSYIGFTFDGEWPPAGVTLTYVPNSNVDSATLDISQQSIPCFVEGTIIATGAGFLAIEHIEEGMEIWTRDNGLQTLRWIGSRQLSGTDLARNPKLLPIRIRQGALGKDTPSADLLVSPQHRVLVKSSIAQRMFGTHEVLVAAKQLLQIDGIDIAEDLPQVRYFHMLFDRHEIVSSNGAETESLYTGAEAMQSLGRQARAEIFEIFPELASGTPASEPARPLASGRMGRKLAIRHAQNDRALVS